MGIILGLLAALGWGSADFLARYATRQVGFFRTLLYMQFIGLIGLTFYLVATGELGYLLASQSWQPWAWATVAAILNVLSSIALYRAFEIGVLTVVSAIGASYAAVTVVFALLNGETVSQIHAIGMAVVLVGVVFAALHFQAKHTNEQAEQEDSTETREKRGLSQGVFWAISASIGYGLCFWILGFRTIPVLGTLTPIWLIRLMTPILLVVLAPVLRQGIALPSGRLWWNLSIIGLLDTVAYVANTLGTVVSTVSVINVLSSLYSAVTVILAWLFLREQLRWSQWLGVGVIFVGVVLVNL